MKQKQPNPEKSLGPISPADAPLNALPVVELTSKHIEKALELADRGNDSYKTIDAGVVFGSRDALTSHQIDLLGELAVAQLYGLNVDANTYQRGDSGKDHSLFGTNADVKTTATRKIERPELRIHADKPLRAELYILAHVTDWTSSAARVRLIGCASRKTVKAQTPRCHPGSTKNYVVSPAEMDFLPLLRPIDS